MSAPTIRSTTDLDRNAVIDVVGRAFSDESRVGSEEIEIVVRTWALSSSRDAIDLVAVADEAIAGQVLAAPGDLDGTALLAVAPLAVAPERQRCGLGSALMLELLRRAEDADWPAVVLLGNPDYYGRFGFEAAAPLGIVYQPVGTDSPHFQIRRLPRYRVSLKGAFRYIWE